MRIGLIADTHMPGSIKELWAGVYKIFDGVEGILHAGDLHTLDLVDQLSKIAPTWVARGNGDRGLIDDRLRDSWLLEFNGLSVGMVHHFPTLENKSEEIVMGKIAKLFPESTPDMIVYGHTHKESIHQLNDILLVNPGSPTLPRNQSLRPGTVGVMEVRASHTEISIYQLSAEGMASEATSINSLFPRPVTLSSE